MLLGIDNPLAVFDGWQRWHVEHPEISVWNPLPSRCFLWPAALARGAFSEFCLELMTLSFSFVGGSAGA